MSADEPHSSEVGDGLGKARRPGKGKGPGAGRRKGRPGRRLEKALSEIEDLRGRVSQLERDIQESRQLNKRLAEVTDVVAEVLLPAEQRDEARLRELLANYDKAF